MKYSQVLISRAANGFTIIAVGEKKGDSETYIASDLKGVHHTVEEVFTAYEDSSLSNPEGTGSPWGSNFGPSSLS